MFAMHCSFANCCKLLMNYSETKFRAGFIDIISSHHNNSGKQSLGFRRRTREALQESSNSQQAAKCTRWNNEPYKFEATAGNTGKRPTESPNVWFTAFLFSKQAHSGPVLSKRCETYGWTPYHMIVSGDGTLGECV